MLRKNFYLKPNNNKYCLVLLPENYNRLISFPSSFIFPKYTFGLNNKEKIVGAHENFLQSYIKAFKNQILEKTLKNDKIVYI
jgi:hypothetical protein